MNKVRRADLKEKEREREREREKEENKEKNILRVRIENILCTSSRLVFTTRFIFFSATFPLVASDREIIEDATE